MRPMSRMLWLAICLLACGRLAAGDWPQFRGPSGQGHSPARGLPLTWSDKEHVAWTADIPGNGWSSPVVADGLIFLTTAVPERSNDEAAQSLRALALDAKSGKIVWNVEVFHQPGGEKIHSKNSHASATPLVDGDDVFVHFGTHGTARLNRAGKVAWKNRELKYKPMHGNGGSPALIDDLLVLSCDGADVQFVVALDRAKGKIRWKTPRSVKPAKGFSFSTPLAIQVEGETQIVSAGPDAVCGYAPRDGREIWKARYPGGYSVVPRPVFGNGMLYVSTGYDSPELLAIRPGRGDITQTHIAWEVKRGVPLNPSPLLVDKDLYLISDNGIVSCLDASTGDSRWQKRVGGNFSASPLFADGRIYLQSEEGEGIVLEPGLEYKELARNSLHERSLASYAAIDGALFIRSEGHLRRINGP